MKSWHFCSCVSLSSLCRCTAAMIVLAGFGVTPVPATAQATAAQTKTTKEAKPVAIADDPEVKLGRGFAEENDKHVKLITDSAIVERVNRIGNEIAAVADEVR